MKCKICNQPAIEISFWHGDLVCQICYARKRENQRLNIKEKEVE